MVTFVTDIFYLIPYNYVVIDLIYPSPVDLGDFKNHQSTSHLLLKKKEKSLENSNDFSLFSYFKILQNSILFHQLFLFLSIRL